MALEIPLPGTHTATRIFQHLSASQHHQPNAFGTKVLAPALVLKLLR